MSTQTLTRDTRVADTMSATSVAQFPSAVAEVQSSRASFNQEMVLHAKHFAPLIGCIVSLLIFASLLWGVVRFSDQLTSSLTCIGCAVALSIPLFFVVRFLKQFVVVVKKASKSDSSNAASICAVEVCINNETVLTVRSWWPLRMTNADVEKHGIRVAMSSARRWLAENSQPGGKITRVRFDEQSAADLCNEYICESSNTANHCSVCLDDIEANSCIKMRKCGHCFHSDCLSCWFSQSSRLVCPMCRADHHSLVPPTVIKEHTVKEEPSISVLSVSVELGTLSPSQ